MADGVKKRKRKQKSSTERRHTRATLSNLVGTEMVKCTRCKEKNLSDCRTSESSDVCGNCLSVGNHSCDAFGFSDSAVRRIVDEERDLDEQERVATDAIRTAQRELLNANRDLVTALAKADRLRTQRLALKRKALAMFDQEGKVLEEQERREAAVPGPSWAQKYVPLSFLLVLADCLSFSLDDPFFAGVDLSGGVPLVGLGSSGGTPEASRGS